LYQLLYLLSYIPCSTDLSIFQQKAKKGYQATHKALLGQMLASTANQEGFTYEHNDDDDDDVQNIGTMDIYKSKQHL
jgi:hypothetical protein